MRFYQIIRPFFLSRWGTLFGIVCLISGSIYAAESSVLTLNQYLTKLIEVHPMVQLNETRYQKELRRLDAVSSISDWTLFGQSNVNKGAELFGQFNQDTTQFQTNMGISKLVSQTGTRLTLSGGYFIMKDPPSLSESMPFPNQYNAQVQFEIVQPLLKNMMGKLDQFPIQLSELEQRLAKIKYETDLNMFIQSHVNVYLEWVYAFRYLQIRRDQLTKANRQFEIIARQSKTGVSDQSDYVLAEQNVMLSQMVVEEAAHAFREKTRAILNDLGIQFEMDKRFIPDPNFRLDPPTVDLWTYLQSASSVAKTFDVSNEMMNLSIDAAKVAMLPRLDLVGSITGLNNASSAGDMFSGQFENRESKLGFLFEYPLSNRKQKAAYQDAVLSKFETQLSHADEWAKIRFKVDALTLGLGLIETQLQTLTKVQFLSQKRAGLEKEKYNQGRSQSLTFVINAENTVLDNQISVLNLQFRQYQLYNTQLALTDAYARQFNNPSQRNAE